MAHRTYSTSPVWPYSCDDAHSPQMFTVARDKNNEGAELSPGAFVMFVDQPERQPAVKSASGICASAG